MLSGYYENYWSILKLYDSTTVPMLINKLIQQLFSNYYQLLNQFICSTPQNTHFFFKKTLILLYSLFVSYSLHFKLIYI